MDFGIVGCGLMGRRRAEALKHVPGARLASCFDVNEEGCRAFAVKFGCEAYGPKAEAVIVAVPHCDAMQYVTCSLREGHHVLCEKPMGLNLTEAEEIAEIAEKSKGLLAVGFNYRFLPHVRELRRMGLSGTTHCRMVLGHGNRDGCEGEWKMRKALAGGGALLDPGVHLIDLTRFLFGEVESWAVKTWNAHWRADVEDNAFALLETNRGVNVSIHVSTTEWRNLFRIEVFTDDWEAVLAGRGGSYGDTTLSVFPREGTGGDRTEIVETWNDSLVQELREFVKVVEGGESDTLATWRDGLTAWKVVDGMYQNSGLESVGDYDFS